MKTLINRLLIFLMIVLVLSCRDESLDPFRVNDLKKGSILALRGDAFANLNNTGCSNSFFFNKIVGNETFSFDADFLAEDPNSLDKVDVYASLDGGTRVLVTSVPGSEFSVPTGGRYPRGNISFTLAEVLTALAVTDPTTIGTFDLLIESDVTLKDGTVVPASAIVNSGLFESAIFYPAQSLSYCALDVNDFRPVVSLSLASGAPLQGTESDTVLIEFDQIIADDPTIRLNPAKGTLGNLVKVTDSDNEFYAVYTAPAGFTGTVYVVVEAATSGEEGALSGLEQLADSIGISVDNEDPQVASLVTGTRIGRSQFAIITVTFNELMDPSDTLLIDVTGQNMDPVIDAPMVFAEDGISASYVYNYKDSDNPSDATHGPLNISIQEGSDLAGNEFTGRTATLLNDIGTPPEPTAQLANEYDVGTQLKWTINQTNSLLTNPNGSTTGTVYFVALPDGSPAPGQATTTVDGVTVYNGFDLTGLDVREQGSVNVTNGTSGIVFTPFEANGDLDLYLYFVSNTGNVSPNTLLPVSITMN